MTALLILIRIPLYGAAAYLALIVVAPAIGGFLGFIVSTPLAAVVIAIDILLSATLRRRSIEAEATARILSVDRAMARPGDSLTDRLAGGQLEGQVFEAELLEEDTKPEPPRLGPGA